MNGADSRKSFATVNTGSSSYSSLPFPRYGRSFRSILAICAVVFTIVLVVSGTKAHTIPRWTTTSSKSMDSQHLVHLASPLTDSERSTTANGEAWVIGEHHLVQGKYPQDYKWIDSFARMPFVEVMKENGNTNSAIGRMPAGSPYDALIVARGRNDKYKDAREGISYVNLTIVGFFANYNAATSEWERVGPIPYVLDLPVWRQYPRPCLNLVNGGPADPRFLWSDAGEPLAVIGTASRVAGICKSVGLVDLRAVWPGLKTHMDELGYGHIPIKFDTFTEVGKASKKELYEKNWAPFFAGPKPATPNSDRRIFSSLNAWRAERSDFSWPYFASQVIPRSILSVNPSLDSSHRSLDSYVLAEEIDLSSPGNDTLSFASSDCLINSLPQQWDMHKNLHQATPFHRVTMCPRETCVPSVQNTVLLGLIHYKIASANYRRMFVTMETSPPFKLVSVSHPLHFGTVKSDEEVVFAVSLAFFPTKLAGNAKDAMSESGSFWKTSQDTPGGYLHHGWLDDTLVVGAGLRNEQYDSIHMSVGDALRGHTLC